MTQVNSPGASNTHYSAVDRSVPVDPQTVRSFAQALNPSSASVDEIMLAAAGNDAITGNRRSSGFSGVDQNGMVTGGAVIHDRATNAEHGNLSQVNGLVLHRTASDNYSKPIGANGAHFYIDKDGTIYQPVSLDKQAQHTGPLKSKCRDDASTCSSQEYKKSRDIQGIENLSHYEKTKDYPDRYPANFDSIGIEVVGRPSGNGDWDPLTPAQTNSLNNLVDFLERKYGLSANDYYSHDEISYRTGTEGKRALEAIK